MTEDLKNLFHKEAQTHSEYWEKLGYAKGFYSRHHGLHVIDNVVVDGCKPCEERAILIATAALTGEKEKRA